MRHYLFFALPIVLASTLAWIGILPPGDWTEVVKWSVIVGACAVFAVGFGQGFGQGFASALALRHCHPPLPPVTDCFPSEFFDNTEAGTGMAPSGIFAGGFGGGAPIGSGIPPNYTSLERDPGAPPATTVGVMGQTVTVPVAGHSELDFDDAREIDPLIAEWRAERRAAGLDAPALHQHAHHSGDITVTSPKPKPPV